MVPTFRGDSDTHYLYLLWVVRDPANESLSAWIQTLRLWLLIQALERAARRPQAILLDDLIKDACLRPRMACEEKDLHRWSEVMRQLDGGAMSWWRLAQHLRTAESRLKLTLVPEVDDRERRAWLRTIERISEGEAKPSPLASNARVHRRFEELARISDAPVPVPEIHDLEEDLAPPSFVPSASSTESDDDDDEIQQDVQVDPEASTAAQELSGRYVQLLTGADTRFLPWAWSVPTPPERDTLNAACADALRSADLRRRVLGAMVSLAVLLGRSLEMTSRLRLIPPNDAPAEPEWQIDLGRGLAIRRAPRRTGHWRPDDSHTLLIHPFANQQTLALPEAVLDALRAAGHLNPSATRLGELWNSLRAGPLRQSFLDWRNDHDALRRVNQGMLAGCLAYDTFERTGDHVLARLLSSTATSGLPASTAYTAFAAGDLVAAGLPTPDSSDVNVAGSLLNPVDDFLRQRIDEAWQRLHQLNTGSFVEFHNEVCRYWDSAWRAGTGIRPLLERWRSLTELSDHPLDDSSPPPFIYVDDKPGLQARRARLVPIPGSLWSVFSQSYLTRHLAHLRAWLEVNSPEASRELFDGQRLTQNTPMLFLLSGAGATLKVVPIGQGQRDLIEHPLRGNVYRHRLRTRLHQRGANPEVIDSILGHLDGATSSHGDFSPRIWLKDAKQISETQQKIYDALGFKEPPDYEGDYGAAPSVPLAFAARSPAATTSPVRARRKLRVRAALQARAIVASELNVPSTPTRSGRSPCTVEALLEAIARVEDPTVLERVGSRLMRSEAGSPTTLGPHRYDYLINLLDLVWEVHDRRPPVRRRFLHVPRDDSPILPVSTTALQHRAACGAALVAAVSDLTPSRLTAQEAVWLALFDLLLLNRCTDPALRSVLIERHPFRLVTLADKLYLEWNADGLIDSIDSPVQRLRISARTAQALTVVLTGAAKVAEPNSSPPLRFLPLARVCTRSEKATLTLRSVFDSLASTIDACNAIETPGIVAAYLAGRLRSTSPHWGEWVEQLTKLPRDLRGVELLTDTPNSSKDPRPRRLRLATLSHALQAPRPTAQVTALAQRLAKAPTSAESQRNAKALFAEVRKILNSIDDRNAMESQANRRRAARRKIEDLAHRDSAGTSSAVRLLILWTASMLDRGRTKHLLRATAIKRYLDALTKRFVALAHDRDLLLMDAEEIEELYADLIALPLQSGARYPYARLREFHRFGEQAFDLPSIDWSAIVPDKEPKLCAPGLVDESTFRRILIAIHYNSSLDRDERTAAMVLVMLAYRFGLRGGEALGLLLQDLHLAESTPWLSVERNRARQLKTNAARRNVPLLQRLRPLERRMLETQIALAKAAEMNGTAGHLFPTHLGGSGDRLRRDVNAIIQQVTGKPYLSLHHLRHSFACEVWSDLQGNEFVADAGEHTTFNTTRELLLGRNAGTTRRSPWALARLLGHVHPGTSFFSYVHTLGASADSWCCIDEGEKWVSPAKKAGRAEGWLYLDELPKLDVRVSRCPTPLQDVSATDVLSILVLLDSDAPAQRIASRFAIEPSIAARMAAVCGDVMARLRAFDAPKRARATATSGVMSHILASAYPRIGQQIAKLYEPEAKAKLSRLDITQEEFASLFGFNRTIGMFRLAQFRLVKMVLEIIDVPRSQLRIGAPATLSTQVHDLAIRTGWLTATGNHVRTPGSFDLNVDQTLDLDAHRFLGEAVRHRLVLSLGQRAGAKISNRWELICVLLATIPVLVFSEERE